MDTIILMLSFFMPFIIWSGCTVGSFLAKVWNKYHQYRNGYEAGFRDGVMKAKQAFDEVYQRRWK